MNKKMRTTRRITVTEETTTSVSFGHDVFHCPVCGFDTGQSSVSRKKVLTDISGTGDARKQSGSAFQTDQTLATFSHDDFEENL